LKKPTKKQLILFIDGLPGSGKSMTAAEIGCRCPDSRIFLESDPNHPLRVGAPDKMGAAFGDIHQAHTADSFATMSLQKLDAFLQTSKSDVRYVFESYPVKALFGSCFNWIRPSQRYLGSGTICRIG